MISHVNVFCLIISEEFVAHGASVNCLALGHKSGRVLVTGGDDKKVNLWAVGKPNCIMVSNLIYFLTKTAQKNLHNIIPSKSGLSRKNWA